MSTINQRFTFLDEQRFKDHHKNHIEKASHLDNNWAGKIVLIPLKRDYQTFCR